jgi:tripartite-type tricarboxylate transporter receptor subunit TctC
MPMIGRLMIGRLMIGRLMIGRLAALLLFAAAYGSSLVAHAQNWPSRQIEMIIAFPAGSGVDVIGRAIAAAISQQTGQTVVVLNRDGAAGTLGFAALAAAAPDGHTLAFGPTTPIANSPYLVKGVRYNVESFSYICQVFENVFAIAVGPQSKVKTAQELFATATQNPGTLTYGHAGIGTIPHLSMENTAEALKTKFTAVPFRGDAPLVPALLRGEVDFAAAGVSTIRPQPAIRPLAIFSDKRHQAYPEVQTVRELGVAVGVPPGHNGLFAPAGLPAELRNALERACVAVLKQDSIRKVMENTGQTIEYLNGANFHAQTVADYTSKGELIKRLGLGAQ